MGTGLLRRKSDLHKVGEREKRSQITWAVEPSDSFKYILRRAPQPQSGELIIKKALGVRSRGNQQVRDAD